MPQTALVSRNLLNQPGFPGELRFVEAPKKCGQAEEEDALADTATQMFAAMFHKGRNVLQPQWGLRKMGTVPTALEQGLCRPSKLPSRDGAGTSPASLALPA